MQPLSYLVFTFLYRLSFLSPVLSLRCNDRQYPWPVDPPRLCCDKCPPGERMFEREKESCQIECKPCIGERYMDTYNVEMSCEICENCNKINMEYLSYCNTTHNAVCRCKAGFKCKDQSCKQCVPLPSTTTKPTLPPPTTASKLGGLTTLITPQPIRDKVWFLVIIALLCAGIALLLVTKIKPFLRWIKSNHGYFLAKEQAPTPPCSEDEEVSKPVQEALGKCDV